VKKLIFIAFIVVLTASLILAGCGKTATTTTAAPTTTAPTTAAPTKSVSPTTLQPQDGGVLRIIGTEGPNGSLGIPENVRGMPGLNGSMIEPLYSMSADGKVTYFLATGLQWSSDYKTVTIKLRKGVKFHDGTDFNAQVAIWNWDRAMAAKVDGTENVESYKAIDDYTIQMTCKQYINAWAQKPGIPLGFIISSSWVEKMGVDYVNWHPCGTGPFKFVEYKENEYLQVERFDGYWGDRPHLDGIKYLFIADPVTAQISFQAGEGDVISVMSGGPKMAHDLIPLGFKVDAPPGGLGTCFIPSVTNPDSPLANAKVRQAIEYALDKVKIAKNVGLGYYSALYQYAGPVEAPFDPNFKGRVYDPVKARQLLAEAGYPTGFKTKLICGTHLAGDELAAMQANLKDVGIDAEIELVSVPKWIELETNGWPEGLLETPTSLGSDYGTLILRYLIKPLQPNWYRGLYWDSLYRPDAFQTLLEQYMVIPDQSSQAAIDKGREIVKMIYDQASIIPLYESLGMGGIFITQPWVHDRTVNAPPNSWNYTGTWISSK
jgi:peptide/nickel transport system substrate-binding protein